MSLGAMGLLVREIDVKKTKVMLNKMMDLVDLDGLSGVGVVSLTFSAYFNFLYQHCFIDGVMYEDALSTKDRVENWLNLTDKRLPRTYEKYLLLSRLFGCEVDDIIFNNFTDLNEFSLALEKSEESDCCDYTVYLPRIREKMKSSRHWRDRFVNYSTHPFLSGDLKLSEGLTLLDKVTAYCSKNNINEKDISNIVSYINNNIIDSWRDGRYLIGMETLATFCKITGLTYQEIYNETNELIKIHILNEEREKMKSAPFSYPFTSNIKTIIDSYLSKNNLDIYKIERDCLITKCKSLNKYGLVALIDDDLCYLPAQYDYVVKSKKQVYVIADNKVSTITTQEWDRLLVCQRVCKQQQTTLSLLSLGVAILASYNCGAICFSSDEGIMAISPHYPLSKVRQAGEVLTVNHKGVRYYGYINDNFVIAPIYQQPIKQGEGYFTIKQNEKYGFLDDLGKQIIEPIYEDASIFSEGLVAVKVFNKYGYINKEGKLVIEPKFDYACDFTNGLACVTIKQKDGFINKSGQIVIKPEFDIAFRFSESIAVIKLNGKYGYINNQGDIKLKPIYEGATLCKNGQVQVLSGGNLIKKQI